MYGNFTYSYGWISSAFIYWLPSPLFLYIQFAIWLVAALRYIFNIPALVALAILFCFQTLLNTLSYLGLVEGEHYRALTASILVSVCVCISIRMNPNVNRKTIIIAYFTIFLAATMMTRYGRDFLIVTLTLNQYQTRIVDIESGGKFKSLRIPRNDFSKFTPYIGVYELEIHKRKVRLGTREDSFHWTDHEQQKLIDPLSVRENYEHGLTYYDRYKNAPRYNYFLPTSSDFNLAIQCSSSNRTITHRCKRVPGLRHGSIRFEYNISEAEFSDWRKVEKSIASVIQSYTF